jgi:plasmid maintenance system antidote protein VapI
LKPQGLTNDRLGKDIGAPPQRIHNIVAGKRATTADTGPRLNRYVGHSDGWWPLSQASFDTAMTRQPIDGALSEIRRWALLLVCAAPALLSPQHRPC